MPTGSPDAVRPTGTTVAGRWVNVANAIQAIRSVYGRIAPSTWITRSGNGSLWSCGMAGTIATGISRASTPTKKSAISARSCSRFSLASTQSR